MTVHSKSCYLILILLVGVTLAEHCYFDLDCKPGQKCVDRSCTGQTDH